MVRMILILTPGYRISFHGYKEGRVVRSTSSGVDIFEPSFVIISESFLLVSCVESIPSMFFYKLPNTNQNMYPAQIV